MYLCIIFLVNIIFFYVCFVHAQSLSEYYTQYYEILNTEYSHLVDSIGRFTIPFTPLFVDAIWTLALALHRSEIGKY